MSEKKITVFTPTYNRKDKLIKLYNSLVEQTDQSFIWLIVDDGSNDKTGEEISNWIAENKISIQYFYQTNGGKSSAHNRGVIETTTELFVCVDSDDYLRSDAIEIINKIWLDKKEHDIGIIALREVSIFSEKRGYKAGIRTTLAKAYKGGGISGDTMLVYKTDIISQYLFPQIDGEKFVPEAYLYDKLDQLGDMIFLDEVLYFGTYEQDGYTKNMRRLLKNNPKGYLLFIRQRIEYDKTIYDKIKDTIRYICMGIVAKEKHIILSSKYPALTVIVYPFGWLFYMLSYRNI